MWILLYFFEYLYYKISDKIFTVSEIERDFAIKKFNVNPKKIFYAPHGITFDRVPDNKKQCREFLLKKYNINSQTLLLLFNGSLSYTPNINALDKIINFIIPALNKKNIAYKIIICGRGLPERFNNFQQNPEIIFASFVDDIAPYNIGADVMINPVIEGGGVKVKLLEALAYNLYCISTHSGALGVSQYVCGNKLRVVEDNDWQNFAYQILQIATSKTVEDIPKAFYDLYFMENVAQRMATILRPL